jgi:ABC-2 type transport system ATP-binding protein
MDTPENLKKSIGEGDILEIELQDMTKELPLKLEQLDDITTIIVDDNHLTIRLLDAITKLPDIIHIIEDEKLNLNDISIRQNTLEDVFIELTGRALREN